MRLRFLQIGGTGYRGRAELLPMSPHVDAALTATPLAVSAFCWAGL